MVPRRAGAKAGEGAEAEAGAEAGAGASAGAGDGSAAGGLSGRTPSHPPTSSTSAPSAARAALCILATTQTPPAAAPGPARPPTWRTAGAETVRSRLRRWPLEVVPVLCADPEAGCPLCTAADCEPVAAGPGVFIYNLCSRCRRMAARTLLPRPAEISSDSR